MYLSNICIRDCRYTYFYNYYVILFLITGVFPNCKNGSFACNKSEVCILNKYVCDGQVHCAVNGSYAEDEDFNLCKSRGAFPKGANLECIEAYRPKNPPIKILATSYDLHIECQNFADEVWLSGKL